LESKRNHVCGCMEKEERGGMHLRGAKGKERGEGKRTEIRGVRKQESDRKLSPEKNWKEKRGTRRVVLKGKTSLESDNTKKGGGFRRRSLYDPRTQRRSSVPSGGDGGGGWVATRSEC